MMFLDKDEGLDASEKANILYLSRETVIQNLLINKLFN